MSIGLAFWLLMIIVLIGGGGIGYLGWAGQRGPFFSWLLLYILLFLLGWHDFGFIIQGR